MRNKVRQLDGEFYTIKDVSEMTDVPVATLRSWYKPGTGMKAPSKQVSFGKLTVYLYTPEDIEEIKQRKAEQNDRNR